MSGWSLRTRVRRRGGGLTSHLANDRQRAGIGAYTPPARAEIGFPALLRRLGPFALDDAPLEWTDALVIRDPKRLPFRRAT